MRYIKNRIFLSLIIICLICECKENINPNQKISYYKNGNVSSIRTYKNDTVIGQEIWFDSLGTVREILPFKNGLRDGEAYSYYPNGSIKSQRTWRNNKRVGYGDDYWNAFGSVKTLYWYNDDTIQYFKCFNQNGVMLKEEGVHPSMDDYINLYFPKTK